MSRTIPARKIRDEVIRDQRTGVDGASRPGAVVLRPYGNLDVHAVPKLLQAFTDAVAAAAVAGDRLVVELAAVTLADSAVLGALVLVWKRATLAGVDVEFVEPRRELRRLFDITGLDRMLPVSVVPAAERGA